MENTNNTTSKRKTSFMDIIKRYGYYFALAFLIGVLALMIVLTSVNATTQTSNDEPATETKVEAITFSAPLMNATIKKRYSDTELQYNSALNVWELHRAVDFAADVGTDVLAAYNGTIKDISTNLLTGTTITIDHGNNLLTVYGSLDSNTNVKVGDTVVKGDVIGKASNTASGEVVNEGEVHFEVWKDGSVVDPANYLDISTK